MILRFQQASDVEFLVDLWSNAEVTRYMGGPRDRGMLRSGFEETANDPSAERFVLWPLADKKSGQPVGHCGLLDKQVEGNNEIELVYVLAPTAWGRGYATEIGNALKRYAFGELSIRRLIALIEPRNAASERVAVKIGMRLEKEVTRPGGGIRKMYVIKSKDDKGAA